MSFSTATIDYEFFKDVDEFLSKSSERVHILLSVDTIHYGDSKAIFKHLKKTIADSSTIVGNLADYHITLKI